MAKLNTVNIPDSLFIGAGNRIGVLLKAFTSGVEAKFYISQFYEKNCSNSEMRKRLCKQDSILVDFYYNECKLPDGKFDLNKFQTEAEEKIKLMNMCPDGVEAMI